VQPGWPGYLDVSQTIVPLDKPDGPVDRSQDVHPHGNPHYLLDPVNGIRVAALVRDRLVALRADHTDELDARFEAFKKRVGAALYGNAVAAKYDIDQLDVLADAGTLDQFLDSQADGRSSAAARAHEVGARDEGGRRPPALDLLRAPLRPGGGRAHGAEARHPAEDQAAR
jgi:hypothetical protein